MNQSYALDVFGAIIPTLSILIGFLLIFLELVPERRRRKLELLQGKFFDLEIKRIDALIAGKSCDISISEKIDEQQRIICLIQNRLTPQRLHITILGLEIPLNAINYIVLGYCVLIFALSLLYMGKISLCSNTASALIVNAFIVLTVLGFLSLIPVSYWSSVKEYKLNSTQESSEE